MATAPGLTFGALNFIGTAAELTANGYRFEAMGDDAEWGNPEPIEDKVISWLQDGAIVALKNYDNRELNIRVRIVGADLNKLALGEQALMLETGKPNLLTWTPPDATAAPCVFSVVMSSLDFAFDDLAENRDQRMYALRIIAEPFVRSQALVSVSVPAPTGTQVITSVDPCTSNSGWSQTALPSGGSPTVTTPSVTGATAILANVNNISTTVPTRLSLTRSGLSTGIGSTPYIRIDSQFFGSNQTATSPPGSGLAFKLNGLAAPIASQTGNIYWFDAGALGITTLASVEVAASFIASQAPNQSTFIVSDISRSNVLGEVGTKRQLSRTVAVNGSARTQANLAVEDASAALGTALIYTYPTTAGAIAPPMRAYRTSSGSDTADATAVSGVATGIYAGLEGAMEIEIPVAGIQPGGHLIIGRFKNASSGPQVVYCEVRGKQGSTTFGAATTGLTTFAASAGVWTTQLVGTLNLPSVLMGSAGKLQFQLGSQTSGTKLDEAWAFNIETGQLTWIECGSASPAAGGSSNRLFLDAATVNSPAPAVYVGFAADRTDSRNPGSSTTSFGQHQFVPPATNVFTVTTNSTAAGVTLSHFPRWHTHVAS